MNHYVYRITNIILEKHYYGVRSSECMPSDDIGVKYFNSSKDKEFINDQRKNPSNYRYKIIRVYSSRDLAVKLEIRLHNKFNVGVNESFYNRAKQTSVGWDTTGISSTPLIGEKNGMYGKTHTEEVRKKLSEAAKGNTNWKDRQHTCETKEKISAARALQTISQETKDKWSKNRSGAGNAMFGKKHSDESKRKMSESKKGRIPWNKGLKIKKDPCPIDVA